MFRSLTSSRTVASGSAIVLRRFKRAVVQRVFGHPKVEFRLVNLANIWQRSVQTF